MKLKKKPIILLMCALILLWANSAMAISITYNLNDETDIVTGNNLWSAEFTVTDPNFATGEGFQILFNHELYGDVSLGNTPVAFDPLVMESQEIGNTGFFTDTKYDLLALEDVDTAFSFTLSFNWLGSDLNDMGSFDFLAYDSSFQEVESGTATSPVPEPGTMVLMGLGLLGLGGMCRKKFNGGGERNV